MRQKAEAMQQWEAQQTAVKAVHDAHGPTVLSSGSLGGKSKADLLKLTQALEISLNGAQNNPKHVFLIKAQLNGHPQLKDDPKFTGLYGCLPYGQKHTYTSMINENAAPAESLQIEPPAICC